MFQRRLAFLAITASLISLTLACNAPDTSPAPGEGLTPPLPDISLSDPKNPEIPPPAHLTDVLLYNGTGVSTSDWQNTEQIVKAEKLSYQIANASQLNAMTLDEITGFGVIIVPGGSGGTIAGGLTAATRLNLRKAVRDYGVGYVGFCAGAWVAVGPEASTNNTASYGFAIAPGNVLSLFLPGGQAPTAAMVDVKFVDGATRNLVWWGGPYTPEWKDGVIARYDTGQPAISETFSGKGLVVISGPHPEAPQSWRSTAGNDRDGLDYDIALNMIHAAINKQPLKAF